MSVTGSQTAATPLIIGASLVGWSRHLRRAATRGMAQRFDAGPSAATADGLARLSARAFDAQHDVGHRRQALGRDRLPTRVAAPVGALVELDQGTLGALELGLERGADADLGQAAD